MHVKVLSSIAVRQGLDSFGAMHTVGLRWYGCLALHRTKLRHLLVRQHPCDPMHPKLEELLCGQHLMYKNKLFPPFSEDMTALPIFFFRNLHDYSTLKKHVAGLAHFFNRRDSGLSRGIAVDTAFT